MFRTLTKEPMAPFIRTCESQKLLAPRVQLISAFGICCDSAGLANVQSWITFKFRWTPIPHHYPQKHPRVYLRPVEIFFRLIYGT